MTLCLNLAARATVRCCTVHTGTARIGGQRRLRLGSPRVERVVIFGCAGSGKSTLARALSARTSLPVVERDGLGRLGSSSYLCAVEQISHRQRWIFDGPPYFTEDLVYGLADTGAAPR